MSDPKHQRKEKGKGRMVCIPQVPPFHRWVLGVGLIFLIVWLLFNVGADFLKSRMPELSKAAGDGPETLYTLGFWFTAFGVALEVAYCFAVGYMIRNSEHQQFSELSGRTRFRRTKRKYKGVPVETEAAADVIYGPVEK